MSTRYPVTGSKTSSLNSNPMDLRPCATAACRGRDRTLFADFGLNNLTFKRPCRGQLTKYDHTTKKLRPQHKENIAATSLGYRINQRRWPRPAQFGVLRLGLTQCRTTAAGAEGQLGGPAQQHRASSYEAQTGHYMPSSDALA
jgi:hypothetical protein